MGLYRRSDCGNIWWFDYMAAGRQIRESSGSTNKRVAEKLLALRKTQVLEERWNLPKSNAPRLEQWAKQFLESIQHENTRERYRYSVDTLLEFFGNVRINEITPERINQFQQWRLQRGVHTATVNRDTATLSVMLSKARKLRLITRNPCADVDKLEERRARRQAKPLSYGEEAALKPHCPLWLWMLIVLLIETGLRPKREALALKWVDIDLEATPAHIKVRSSKTPAGCRKVWLTEYCRDALLRWRSFLGPGYSEYVFPALTNPANRLTDYRHAWVKAAKNAGLQGRRIYDLRATFATRANACTTSDLTLAQLLGHSRTSVLPTYAKPLDENTRTLIRGMDAMRLTVTSSKTVN